VLDAIGRFANAHMSQINFLTSSYKIPTRAIAWSNLSSTHNYSSYKK